MTGIIGLIILIGIVFLVIITCIVFKWYKKMYVWERFENIPGGADLQEIMPLAESEYFKLSNGQRIRNIQELLEALENMDVETFNSYANKEKNEFAEWIRNTIKDEVLTNQIELLLLKKDYLHLGNEYKSDFIKLIKQRIKELTKTNKKTCIQKKRETIMIKKEKDLGLEKKEDVKISEELKKPLAEVKKEPYQDPEIFLKELGFFNFGELKTLESILKALKNVDEKKFNNYLAENKVAFDEWVKKTLAYELTEKIRKGYSKEELIRNLKEEIINSLNSEYMDLKKRISGLRKKGKDLTIPDLKILDITPKIQMAKVTEEESDIIKVRKILKDIKEEIDRLERAEKDV